MAIWAGWHQRPFRMASGDLHPPLATSLHGGGGDGTLIQSPYLILFFYIDLGSVRWCRQAGSTMAGPRRQRQARDRMTATFTRALHSGFVRLCLHTTATSVKMEPRGGAPTLDPEKSLPTAVGLMDHLGDGRPTDFVMMRKG